MTALASRGQVTKWSNEPWSLPTQPLVFWRCTISTTVYKAQYQFGSLTDNSAPGNSSWWSNMRQTPTPCSARTMLMCWRSTPRQKWLYNFIATVTCTCSMSSSLAPHQALGARRSTTYMRLVLSICIILAQQYGLVYLDWLHADCKAWWVVHSNRTGSHFRTTVPSQRTTWVGEKMFDVCCRSVLYRHIECSGMLLQWACTEQIVPTVLKSHACTVAILLPSCNAYATVSHVCSMCAFQQLQSW